MTSDFHLLFLSLVGSWSRVRHEGTTSRARYRPSPVKQTSARQHRPTRCVTVSIDGTQVTPGDISIWPIDVMGLKPSTRRFVHASTGGARVEEAPRTAYKGHLG
jgi:hypothetical protein